jgi:transcriptional regulator with XRE-family HTH domain
MHDSSLAPLVRRRRLELRLTQRQAAERAEVSLATWQALERAATDAATFQELTLARVAHGLDLDLSVLLAAGRPREHANGDSPSVAAAAALDPTHEQLVAELTDALLRLAATSEDSFMLVYGQARDATEHLLRAIDT